MTASLPARIGLVGLALIVAMPMQGRGGLLPQLPVVGCKTANPFYPAQVHPSYLPPAALTPAGLDSETASKFAWYEGAVRLQPDLKVLAPRGWRCSAEIYADGGFELTVSPSGLVAGRAVVISGHGGGPGVAIACNFVLSARRASPVPGHCRRPIGAIITRRDAHLFSVLIPPTRGRTPLVDGDYLQPHSLPGALTDRAFLYWYPELSEDEEAVECLLPAADRGLCSALLAEAEVRLRDQLDTLVRKERSGRH